MVDTLSVADPAFAHSHPELHHYTSYVGLSGILESQTIWATHFFHLNDSTEVSLLRDPLTEAVKRRLLRALIDRQRTSVRLRMFLRKRGGAPRVAEGDADRLIQILYEKIFGGGLAVPFIASFCSHVNDQAYERENGLLSQWRGYGKRGGFCIVFDTTAFVTMLEAEFNAYNWTLLSAGGEEACTMSYCITLRSRTDTRIITGWYSGSPCRWSTDDKRREVFDNKRDAAAVCRELHNLGPQNAEVINIEVAQEDSSSEVIPLTFSPLVAC